MTVSIVVLTEQALQPVDAARLVGLHTGDDPSYRVLVPSDTDRNLLVDVVEYLSLLELRAAVDAVRHHDQPRPASAQATLDSSVAALREAGAQADGAVVAGHPLDELAVAVRERSADEVVVVTRPHTLEDTFHTDWASKARERLGVPVLHVYVGSSWVG